jgi:CIC family chloride channel protein
MGMKMNQRRPPAETPMGLLRISIIAVVVGVFAAAGAVVFRWMIAFFHNLLLLGQISIEYNATEHTPPSPWGPFVILAPVIGAIGVVFLVTRFAPEAKGRGVPEVMDAIYYKDGKIRPIVAAIKALASSLCIGSGGPVGREGPIIQIGGTMASVLSHILKIPVRQRITLVAAGAAGGIAATFNTPVGGILFVVELMLFEISAETLVPVMIATATATYISRLVLGPNPAFFIPALGTSIQIENPEILILYAVLGIGLGLVSALYIKAVFAWEDVFEKRFHVNYYVRHMAAMAVLGVVMYLMITYSGHYYIQGVGYATIQDILSGTLTVIWFLVLLFILKITLTTLVLGSGASGGIFSPALFIGATLGGAFGIGLSAVFPDMGISPVAFAVTGMGAMVGGATGAAIAAIVMLFEMTRDYSIIIPLTITVVAAYGVRKLLSRDSLYTLGLKRRGHPIPASLEAYFPEAKEVQAGMEIEFSTVPASGTFRDINTSPYRHLVVAEDNKIIGLISRNRIPGLKNSDTRFGDLAEKTISVPEGTQLSDVATLLRTHTARAALVTRRPGEEGPGDVIGVITEERVDEILAEESEFFPGR